VGLKLNGTHQLLDYAHDFNLLRDNLNTINKNTKYLIYVSKEISLEINVEKIRYMSMSRYQNAGQNHDAKVPNRSSENVSVQKLGTTVSNQTLIQEEIERDCVVHYYAGK
jgi:hypothetical protein